MMTITVVTFIMGCTSPMSNFTSNALNPVSLQDKQYILRVGVLPTQNKEVQSLQIKPIHKYLEKTLGMQIDFLVAKNYKDMVDLIVAEKVDISYVGAVSYLEALERGAKVKPLVAPIDKHTGRPWYRACIIVKTSSGINTLQDLKGKRIAFVNKSSTSGYLMPVAHFKKLGIDLRDFKQVLFPGTYAKTEAALEDGIVDAIATNIPSYLKRQKIGKLTPQNSKVLWESVPVPHSPIIMSQKLPPQLITRLKAAFIKAPSNIEDIVGADVDGYTLVEDSDYQPIRKLRNEFLKN
ncbi:MAG: phosphate/phosphite/phosphonate ABC transporter substrate-binding protein [Calothrix sp. C42_A2020_038]|nr:phosphate/phosphite/phosphonate ABC transporter substrate-binding protein [Calothrix sp. C42_A2020_038]